MVILMQLNNFQIIITFTTPRVSRQELGELAVIPKGELSEALMAISGNHTGRSRTNMYKVLVPGGGGGALLLKLAYV